MNLKIIEKEEIKAHGIAIKLTKSQDKNFILIQNQWGKFNNILTKNNISLGNNWKKYGITFKKNNEYFYAPAIDYKNEFKNFEIMIIKEGKFIQFEHKGNLNKIKDTIHNIYKKLIPESNLEIEQNREIIHYEKYDHKFKWNKPDSIIDIFVPIK